MGVVYQMKVNNEENLIQRFTIGFMYHGSCKKPLHQIIDAPLFQKGIELNGSML